MTIYYFPELPLELCAPAYVLYEDHPVRNTILDTIDELVADLRINGLIDPLIAEVRDDRNGISRIVTVVGIRRWTCLHVLAYTKAPFFVKGKKKNPAIQEVKKYKHRKINNYEEAVSLFGDKTTPGTLMVKRWFPWDDEGVIVLNG